MVGLQSKVARRVGFIFGVRASYGCSVFVIHFVDGFGWLPLFEFSEVVK